MPHRVEAITMTCSAIVEGLLLACGLGFAAINYYLGTLVDQTTLDQLRSSDGALVGAAIIVVALWLSKMADNRKLDARHEEMMRLQQDNSEKLMKLTAESIKAHGMSIQCAQSVDRTLQNLTASLDDRPCQAASFKKPHP